MSELFACQLEKLALYTVMSLMSELFVSVEEIGVVYHKLFNV